MSLVTRDGRMCAWAPNGRRFSATLGSSADEAVSRCAVILSEAKRDYEEWKKKKG